MDNEKNIYDFLTGLYNRKGLYEKYQELSSSSVVHFMFLDLDNFKTVNDVYGHKAGDELLISVANIFKECGKHAVTARLGGDEFVLLFSEYKSREDLIDTANHILSEINNCSKQNGFLTVVSVSIGIVYHAKNHTLEQLLEKSDMAMYQAKQNGKSCYIFYNDMEEKILLEKEMEALSEEAIKKGRFKIFYEPVLHMQNSILIESRVCVRWMKDENTIWDSKDFRPLFEKNDFIKKLDYYTFEEVCKDLQEFHKSNDKLLKWSIQLSRLLFLDESLGFHLQEIMRKYHVKAEEFELNLEESTFGIRSTDRLIQNIEALKKLGFSISIIHFGEDFSCLRYLRNLPVDSIKFDEVYLKENLCNSKGRQIVKTLIKLGKDLKLLVVSHGIENKKDVFFLNGCGCDAASGAFYSEPLTFLQYVEIVKEHIAFQDNRKAFPFKQDISTEDGSVTGEFHGENIKFVPGISDKWGAISFPGGDASCNVISLPGSLFYSNSYTIAFWVYEEKINIWASVIYMRYLGGFGSYVPNIGMGQSVFRINEDMNVSVWHDTTCREIPLHKWYFVVVTYDSFSEFVRYYINGRRAGYRVEVPTLISCRQVIFGGDPFQKSFEGRISAFMVYNSVKTDEEIEALYNSFFDEPGFCGEREDFWMEIN
ncbi:MAG: EAL domain-containing protein [Roseburia sp.]|nr:EAL domain-containing protein [Roseburia sp.]